MITARPVTEPLFTLAEGPVWDAARGRLVWVDIDQGLVVTGHLEGDHLRTASEQRFGGHVGAVAVARDGSMLVAETRSLTRVSPQGARSAPASVEALGPDDRLNDGICDARGRFLVGTLSLTGDHRHQRLLQIDGSSTTVIDDDLGLANGLGFSPGGATLFSIDSETGAVWRRDYDQVTGIAGPRSLLLDLAGLTPDGLAVDDRGRLWVALWGAGEVRCHSLDGRLEETISVPAPHTTSVAFVGEHLDRLVITTARAGLTGIQLDASLLSGSLFIADPGCRGFAPHLLA